MNGNNVKSQVIAGLQYNRGQAKWLESSQIWILSNASRSPDGYRGELIYAWPHVINYITYHIYILCIMNPHLLSGQLLSVSCVLQRGNKIHYWATNIKKLLYNVSCVTCTCSTCKTITLRYVCVLIAMMPYSSKCIVFRLLQGCSQDLRGGGGVHQPSLIVTGNFLFCFVLQFKLYRCKFGWGGGWGLRPLATPLSY